MPKVQNLGRVDPAVLMKFDLFGTQGALQDPNMESLLYQLHDMFTYLVYLVHLAS